MTFLKNRSLGLKLGLSGILIGVLLFFITPFTSFGGFGAPSGAFLLPLYIFLDSLDTSNPLYGFLLVLSFFIYYSLLGTLISYVGYFLIFKLPQGNTKKKK